jgi:hypothetical protein
MPLPNCPAEQPLVRYSPVERCVKLGQRAG